MLMLRRDIRIFKRGIIPALVLVFLCSLLCGAAGFAVCRDTTAEKPPVRVALADGDNSVISRLCISVIENQRFMEALVACESVGDEDTALARIADGSCDAAVILPEGYMEKILTGIPCTGRIVLSEAAASSGEVLRAAAQMGELLLAAGQQGVFAGEQLLAAHGLSAKAHSEYLREINLSLLNFAVEVYDDAFVTELTAFSGTDGCSAGAHYAACWLALLLVLCGMSFSELYTRDCTRPLLQRLYAAGVTPRQFLRGKLLLPALFRLGFVCLLLPLTVRFLPLRCSAVSLLLLMLAILTATVIVSCTAVALSVRGGWQSLLLCGSAANLFLVGGLVPRSMLPSTVTRLGDLLPLGALRALLLPLFGGHVRPEALCAAAVYSAAALGLCLHRLRKGGGAG